MNKSENKIKNIANLMPHVQYITVYYENKIFKFLGYTFRRRTEIIKIVRTFFGFLPAKSDVLIAGLKEIRALFERVDGLIYKEKIEKN